MRIISGQYGGQTFPLPKGFTSRVTTDKAKEALFNILFSNFDFDNLVVLDLFAGSGNISFEFASRGTETITCIEKNNRHVAFIRQLASDKKMTIQVIKADVLKILPALDRKFNIIFADPPFIEKFIPDLPDLVFENNLLEPDGWFILEHDKTNIFKDHPHCFDVRNYGGVYFSLFK